MSTAGAGLNMIAKFMHVNYCINNNQSRVYVGLAVRAVPTHAQTRDSRKESVRRYFFGLMVAIILLFKSAAMSCNFKILFKGVFGPCRQKCAYQYIEKISMD